jgi:uncharacterized protein YjbK
MYRGSFGGKTIAGVILILTLTAIRSNASYLCFLEPDEDTIPSGASLEIELKYELRKKGYRTLIEALKKNIVRETEYRSFYFDTKRGALKKAGLNLRLRMDKRSAQLTLKSGASLKSKANLPIKARWETDQRLTLETARQLHVGEKTFENYRGSIVRKMKTEFPDLDLSKIRNLGFIPSHRTDATLDCGLEIEIDEFVIGPETYFEVEVEFSPGEEKAVHERIVALFEEHDIRWDFSRQSKRSRLIEWQSLKN